MTRTLLFGLLLVVLLLPARAVETKNPPPSYRPVASAAILRAALASNLKLVRHWLDEGDFASAAQTARGVEALAWLHAQQGSDTKWRARADALRKACAGLTAATKGKDPAACVKAADACATLLADLAKGPASGNVPAVKDFNPPGPVKTWMLLMDGAYTDAKSARTPRELERFASEIAEEVNVVSYLRSVPRWRMMAGKVREAALLAAEKARNQDAAAARATLKEAYKRCEACHEEQR